MHSTRRDFLDDFMSFVGEKNDDAARAVAARVLNRAMTAIWLKHPFREYRSPVPLQLTLVANQARYSLPDYFGRVGPGDVRNYTQQGKKLTQRRDGDSERLNPVQGTAFEVAGPPREWETIGVSGVHTQPVVTGDALEVLSDNNNDTDILCAIAGDDSNGRWTRNQVTLTGTTPVAVGTWSFVDEFGKAYLSTATPATDLYSSRGTITLRKTSNAAELQKLFKQEASHEHTIFTVYPKPSAADILLIPVFRKPKRFVNDADPIPDLWDPALWEEALLQWAINRGEMSLSEYLRTPRPALLDLVAFDNESKGPSYTVPFGRL
jgi:hypothetical protein